MQNGDTECPRFYILIFRVNATYAAKLVSFNETSGWFYVWPELLPFGLSVAAFSSSVWLLRVVRLRWGNGWK
jgi:hypothetical protein